ncbi:Hypothetical protein FKW44_006620 [Caligus rogercresseyi]|uniref:Uncharacterized protein n=1 Tax=Caligus rogercresseyi TaxID=217165 RepID=A0A7T8QSY9_CALRO|nr:Hypothetical protein FKW44_006620 [Caligus rogercresseyi]
MTGEHLDPGDTPEKPPKLKKLSESSLRASQKQQKINDLLAIKRPLGECWKTFESNRGT